jgi:hypothetical protein
MPVPARRRRTLLTALAASALLPGCASLAPRTNPGRSTALMKDVGAVRSAVEIRRRADALVPSMGAFIEDTADRIRAASPDPMVRRRALRLKIDLVPVTLRAGFQPDPVAAALDLWLLSYQLEDCFDAGTGPCDFGPQQTIAVAAARAERTAFDTQFTEVTLNPSALERERELVRSAARRYPLQQEESLRNRHSITDELTKAMAVEGLDPFEMLGDVSVTLENLSSRIAIYIDTAARVARWQAELLAEDVVTWPAIDHALGNVDRMSASVDHVATTLSPEFLTGLVERPVDAVHRERLAAMGDIDRQRVETLRFVADQRKALVDTLVASLMAGVEQQRVAALADIRKERVETLDEVERLRRDLIKDGFGEGRDLVDYAVWRLAEVLGAALLLGAALTWVVGRSLRKAHSAP